MADGRYWANRPGLESELCQESDTNPVPIGPDGEQNLRELARPRGIYGLYRASMSRPAAPGALKTGNTAHLATGAAPHRDRLGGIIRPSLPR